VLQAAARDFGYNVEFMASLGVAGVDGTLKEKFTDPSLKRRIRGKTGTLRGVNALTGYGVSPDGKLFVFACIVNCLRNGAGFISHADNVVRAIVEMPLGE
jgi:D-alanyl-D-alanine carboxypeptidase/D-alanyl-D-alanine-endopeptidase (penicillin-binding protein 4)